MVVYEIKGTSQTLDKGNEMGSRHGILFAEDRHIYLNKEMVGMYVLDEAKKRINVTLLVKDPKIIEVLYKMDPKISSQL